MSDRPPGQALLRPGPPPARVGFEAAGTIHPSRIPPPALRARPTLRRTLGEGEARKP
jgi:hypothetical protein